MKKSSIVRAAIAGLTLAATSVWADLNSGLALYYSFNQDNGSAVTDDSGNGRNGAVHGAQYVAQGRIGGAFAFNGVDNMIQVLSSPPSGTKYTVSLWFTSADPVNFSETRQLISDNRRYQLGGFSLGGDSRFYTFALNFADFGPAYEVDTAPVCIEPGTWHQLTMVVDDAVRPVGTIYFDGKVVGGGTGDGVNAGGIQFLIGALNNGGATPVSYWNGMIDEVRVYNRGLTVDEVQELYALANPPPPATAEHLIHSIGFSDDPNGEQDVTEFLADETIYIRVRDVFFTAANAKKSLAASLKGAKGGPRSVTLARQADGSYLGSLALGSFGPGKVSVSIDGTTRNGDSRSFESSINIQATPGSGDGTGSGGHGGHGGKDCKNDR